MNPDKKREITEDDKKYLPFRRISEDNYERPKVTITDMAMKDKKFIDEKLEGYVEIGPNDVDFLVPGIRVRYITHDPKTGKDLFRFGGVIKLVEKDYLVLIGGNNVTFSVQRYIYNKKKLVFSTRFFIKNDNVTKTKIDCGSEINARNNLIQEQQEEIETLKRKIKTLSKQSK